AEKLKSDALALQEIGCFAVVLEKIPAALAQEVSQSLTIPTIGIGAGNGCDGQVLVVNDMLGFTKDFKPKFLRRYMEMYENIVEAAASYTADVKSGNYPNESEQYYSRCLMKIFIIIALIGFLIYLIARRFLSVNTVETSVVRANYRQYFVAIDTSPKLIRRVTQSTIRTVGIGFIL